MTQKIVAPLLLTSLLVPAFAPSKAVAGVALKRAVLFAKVQAQLGWKCAPLQNLPEEIPNLAYSLVHLDDTKAGRQLLSSLKKNKNAICSQKENQMIVGVKAEYIPTLRALVFEYDEDSSFFYFHESLHAQQFASTGYAMSVFSRGSNLAAFLQYELAHEIGAHVMQTVDAYQRWLNGDKADYEKMLGESDDKAPLVLAAQKFDSFIKRHPEENDRLHDRRSLPSPELLDELMSLLLKDGSLDTYIMRDLDQIDRNPKRYGAFVLKAVPIKSGLVRRLTTGSLYSKSVRFPKTTKALWQLGVWLEKAGAKGLEKWVADKFDITVKLSRKAGDNPRVCAGGANYQCQR